MEKICHQDIRFKNLRVCFHLGTLIINPLPITFLCQSTVAAETSWLEEIVAKIW